MIKATGGGGGGSNGGLINYICVLFFGVVSTLANSERVGNQAAQHPLWDFSVREMVRLKIECLKSNSVPCLPCLRLEKT